VNNGTEVLKKFKSRLAVISCIQSAPKRDTPFDKDQPQLPQTNLRDTHIVLYTKMDVRCDKLTTVVGRTELTTSATVDLTSFANDGQFPGIFTARCTVRCTIVQSAVLRSNVVCPSVCDVGGSWPHRLKIMETNCANN